MSFFQSKQFKSAIGFEVLLWGLVLGLFLLQAVFSISFREYLNHEATAESIRSPYWLSQGAVISGVSTAVGYSALVNFAFYFFGFSLYMAKWIRLFLHALSLIALAWMLRRWVGPKLAAVPLLIAGLSPTWLFYNIDQAQFGFDLQIAPIIFLIACYFPIRKPWLFIGGVFLIGFIFFWAALSYPTILFYAPCFLLILTWRWWRNYGMWNWRGFLAPLAAGLLGVFCVLLGFLLSVEDPWLLLYDSRTGSGLLRGGAPGVTRQPGIILGHYWIVLKDLVYESSSYGYWVHFVEFQSWIARFALLGGILGILSTTYLILKRYSILHILRDRDLSLFFAFLVLAICAFNLPQLALSFPGMRRTTGFLFGYYALVAVVWIFLLQNKKVNYSRYFRAALLALLALHPIAHGITLSQNYQARKESLHNNTPAWLKIRSTPEESLAFLEQTTREGNPIPCETIPGGACPLPEIFASIQSMRKWNGMSPAPIKARDPNSGIVREIDLDLWQSREWHYEMK